MKDKLICGQINIPTVDNSEIECDEFISSKCVKIEYPFDINISNLNNFFVFFENTVKELKKSYSSLKIENLNLKNEIKTNTSDINFLKKRISGLNNEILILKNNNNVQ